MTATVDQGVIVAAQVGNPPPRVDQGAVVAAVVFIPPAAPPNVDQGMIMMAVRVFPVSRYLEISPAVDLPCIASCGSVPNFWRQS